MSLAILFKIAFLQKEGVDGTIEDFTLRVSEDTKFILSLTTRVHNYKSQMGRTVHT